MSFEHPWILSLLIVPLAMLIVGWTRHGAEVVLPFDHGVFRSRRFGFLMLRLAASLPAFLLAVTIVIFAGPQRQSEPRTRRIITNIEFLIDVSGSMTAPYGDGNRYDAAMVNVMKFIDARKGDAYGLTFFGSDVLHWVPLTSDPSAVKCAPEFLSPTKLPRWFGGGTMIGKGLESCLDSLTQRGDGDRMIILLTDGYSFDLANGNDEILAEKLRAANIRVYCIHIDNSDPPPEVQLIASRTGGQTFGAGDAAAMPAVFQRIDEMAKARIERAAGETVDDFQPWALAAGGILLASVLAAFGLRFTPMVILPEIIAFVVVALLSLAEVMHARRVRRMARLAFGFGGRARAWTRAAPALRVIAGGLVAWGAASLYLEQPKVFKAREAQPNQQKHVIIVWDVSPSMKLDDAGNDGKIPRYKRAAELMRSFFQRVPMEMVKLTVIATYTESKPVVVDTRDVAVVQNILDDLPLSHAFPSGKTNLFSGIQEAARIAAPWERDSTTLLVLSDGDTIPASGMPRLPISIKDVVLAGVGDARTGKFINGHQSRQDAAALQQIAIRLRGTYHDGNARQLPSDLLRRVTALPEKGVFQKLTRREYALAALGIGAITMVILPWLLLGFASAWRPGVRFQKSAIVQPNIVTS